MSSTAIRRFRYDAVSALLTITFVSGRVYAYAGVPAEVASAFADAASKGTFFNADIRDRYRFTELTGSLGPTRAA